MKKIIFTLLINLFCTMIVKAFDINDFPVVDTLPKKVINGLEVVPIRTTYKSGEVSWRLRAPDYEKKFQCFSSKYPGNINFNLASEEIVETIYNWQDTIWNKIVPANIKTLPDKSLKGYIDILLYTDKNGSTFAVEFFMSNHVFQKLNTLPRDMMKKLYDRLLKEKCNAIQHTEFRYLDMKDESDRGLSWYVRGSEGQGKEYVTIRLKSSVYRMLGTQNKLKLLRMLEEGTLGKLFEKKLGERQ